MKINEAGELLGISKANIRFYEKQGLLTPGRSENRYRDYSDDDIDRLRQIIILRKLGVSVQDIGRLLSGDLQLQEAMPANIASLEQQIEQLTGALKLSKQIKTEELTELDTPRYWEIIHQEEAKGVRFADIMSDYWNNMMEPVFRLLFGGQQKGGSLPQLFGHALLFIVFVTLLERIFWPEDYTSMTILEYPILFLIVYVLCLPYYLFQRKFPGMSGFLLAFLFWVIAAFVVILLAAV